MKDARAGTAPSRRSFAQLATRITAWTTRALLTGVLLVAALGFGRQVILWWRSGGGGPAAMGRLPLANDGFGSLDRLHTLQFGKGPMAFERQTVAGSKDDALKALRKLTRDAVCRAGLPAQAAGDPERRFLAGLSKRRPVDEQPGQWRLYQLDSSAPTYVGVRTLPAPGATGGLSIGEAALAEKLAAAAGGSTAEHAGGTGRPAAALLGKRAVAPGRPAVASGGGKSAGLASGGVAPSACRVVTWGMTIPVTDNAWTLYVFSPGGPTVDGGGAREFPIPPGSDRLLSIEVAGGGRVVSFNGHATPDSWTRFYDSWLLANDWRPHGPWCHRGSIWGLHCESKSAPGGGLDLELVENQTGQLTGLLFYTTQRLQ
jgi:hypothetical protein